MIKKILLAFVVIIAGVLITAALASPEMKVSREVEIAASPEQIFPFINNAKKSYQWMPWSEGDPGIKIEFTGPDEGVGSRSSWHGEQMGVGNSEVTESLTNQMVKTKLVYTKPFAMSQLAEVSLTPTTNGTLVKWSVSGENNFFFRLIGIFVNCDKMIGGEFEKGLGKLKSLIEANKGE
jgi:uncharacterized protein YndB with AHSA1/START domain